MKRISWHLREQQIEALRSKSRETGLSVAELIRRSIDAYLKE